MGRWSRHPYRDRDCPPHRHHGSWHEGGHRAFYLRWRLQRRIFITLTGTIGITVAFGALILRAFGFAIHKPTTSHALWACIFAFFSLWWVARAMARRIAAPMQEVERVVREIGAGNMQARVQLADRKMQVGEMPMLGHTINELASRIDKQLSDQRALLATVSHEIRTPLARMRLLVEFARDDEARLRAELTGSDLTNAKPSAHLDELDKEIVGVDALVSELLAASRIDFGALRRTELVAAQVGRQALERVGAEKAVLDDQTEGATFFGDATLVARAVGNLLENAKRHGGGAVSLRIAARGPRIAFEVDDDGEGFAPGEEQQVFQPFYRGEKHEKNGKADPVASVGLGLALVKRIAEAHGGRAYAQNREGGGARVGIELARSEPVLS